MRRTEHPPADAAGLQLELDGQSLRRRRREEHCWLVIWPGMPRSAGLAVVGSREQFHGDHVAGQALGLQVAGDRVAIARIGAGGSRQVAEPHIDRQPIGADARR